MMDEILKEHLKEKSPGTYEAREMLHLNNDGTTWEDKNFAGNVYLAALHEVAAQAAEIQRLRECLQDIIEDLRDEYLLRSKVYNDAEPLQASLKSAIRRAKSELGKVQS